MEGQNCHRAAKVEDTVLTCLEIPGSPSNKTFYYTQLSSCFNRIARKMDKAHIDLRYLHEVINAARQVERFNNGSKLVTK